MRSISLVLVALVFSSLAAASPAALYHDEEALTTALRLLERGNARASLTALATTAGARDIHLLTVSPSRAAGATPAVLVVGNPLGTTPLATEAALGLARRLVSDEISGRAAAMTWYLIPSLNPDGAAGFFATPRVCDGVNARPEDDDRDGARDEDGPRDLDGDGLIASMLLPDPAGAWLLDDDDPRLPRKADPAAGERGLYRLLTEGDDDDGDGRYNEDGPGGAVPGRNFPHGFTHWQTRNGPWAASEIESRALLEFAFAHPEIAMVLVFGETNTLKAAPTADPTTDPRVMKHKPPRWLAREAGLDTQKMYSVAELLAIGREAFNRPNLTEDDVLSYLSLGPAASPPPSDRKWWDAVSTAYGDSLKAHGPDAPRVDPTTSGSGSVEAWAYYQYGTPAFAVDFWTPPLPVAPTDSLSAGEAPPDTTATGDPSLKALATLGDRALDGAGFRPWREVELADGTKVLTGGEAPFAMRTPAPAMIDSVLAAPLAFLATLPDWLPRLDGIELEIESRGSDLWDVVATVANGGRIPYPTAQGRRSRVPQPVAVTLDGAEILEGRARQVIKQVPAMGSASVRWLVRGSPGDMVNIRAAAPGFGADAVGVALRETGGRR